MRLAYFWDERLCISCMACVIACGNNYPESRYDPEPNPFWNWFASNIKVQENKRGKKAIRLMSCQHCEKAPCVTACPTGASYIDEKTKLVKIDYKKCIRCMACVVSCPYGARWVGKDRYPYKCMGPVCEERLHMGLMPLCVSVCPANARDFGDIDDASSSISQRLRRLKVDRMLEEFGTEPKYFVARSE